MLVHPDGLSCKEFGSCSLDVVTVVLIMRLNEDLPKLHLLRDIQLSRLLQRQISQKQLIRVAEATNCRHQMITTSSMSLSRVESTSTG